MHANSMSRRQWLQNALSLCLVPFPWAHAADIEPSRAIFDIQLPRDTRVTHFYLANPTRLVIDVHGTTMDVMKPALTRTLIVKGADLTDVRMGQNTPTVVRIVLSLSTDLRLSVLVVPRGGHTALSVRQAASASLPPPVKEETPGSKEATSSQVSAPKGTFTVVVDAGHGGEDPGAIGPTGKMEKDITLSLALKISELFSTRPDFDVVLTRTNDVFVPLQKRVAIAREAKADVFMSIHADAWTQPDVRGASVFVLSERGASSSMARLLANKENEVDRFGGLPLSNDPQLAMTLLDLAQTVTKAESDRLAKHILAGLRGTAHIRKSFVERAGFAVLKAPDVPSVLVETAFISNPEEELLLSQPEYQESLADKLAGSVERYLRRRA